MKKKTNIPKKFGYGITGNLFEESGGYEPYPFLERFCEEVRVLDREDTKGYRETLKKILKEIHDPETQKIVKFYWERFIPHMYADVYLTIGFALGQRLDIITPEAKKEINYVWQRLRKEKLFFIYPREKKGGKHGNYSSL